MKRLEELRRSIDRFQQRHGSIAFPIAVLKKFGDDRGGGLAALIAYYGFFSLFPLLLVFVSGLGLVLSEHGELRQRIIDSALGQFPVLGDEIRRRASIQELRGNWIAIVAGGGTALWAGMGVAQAAARGFNTVWGIPRSQWPGFVARRLRALLMLAILGVMVIVSTAVNAFESSGALPLFLPKATGFALSFLLNVVVFASAFEVLTARDLKLHNVLPGAIPAAAGWTVLQALGGLYVTRRVSDASDVYGAFAVVLGLLVWIALGSQLALVCAEINVVWNRRLWPRSLFPPPLTEGDRAVYEAIAEQAQLRPEVNVDVSFVDGPG